MIDAHVHPAGVAGDVVDPVRDRLLHIRAGEEAVILHRYGLAFRAPLPPAHRQPAQLLPLLGVHADHRLARRLVICGLLADVPELRIPVRMLFPLQDLGVALQAEPVVPQQPAHRGRRRPVPLPAQLTSQMPQRLGRPPQRRLRVASLIRLHQRQQRRDQVAVQLRGALASPAAAPHLPLGERRLTGLQLEHARADRRLADPRDLGHGPDPAVPQQPGLSSQQQPPLTLVQMRQQHLEPHRQLIADSGRNAHTTTSNHQSGGDTLFLYGFIARGTSWPRSRPGCRPRSRTPTGRSSIPRT